MDNEFRDTISHCLSPISRGQRGDLADSKSTDTCEDVTSATKGSVFLETRSNGSSREKRLQLGCFALCTAILAFKASRLDYSLFANALLDCLNPVLDAPSGCCQTHVNAAHLHLSKKEGGD